MGLAYALWSGLGIVLIALVSYFYNQKLDVPAIIGLNLIIVGALILNLSSSLHR